MRPDHRFSEEAPGGGLLARMYSRTSLVLLGLLAIALAVGSLALSVGVFTHAFSDPATVTLRLDRAGSQLTSGADVKLHGIIVGRVDTISAAADGTGATLTLALDRDQLHLIPADVTAVVTPKTLFGEKYVDLQLPAAQSAARLTDGATIDPDRSSVAIETSTVLNNLAPLLDAVDPADLNTTLSAVAGAIEGRGAELGESLSASRKLTTAVRPSIPDLLADARLLSSVAGSYTRASGPILDTLDQVSTTARTLTAKERQLVQLLAASNQFASVTGDLVASVGPTALKVVTVSEPLLALLKKYAPELDCTLRGVSRAKERLEAVFADGPYLKARLYVSVSRGMYKYPQDSPQSLDLSAYGPQCPIVPKDGKGTVPWPNIPKELDGIRGQPQPLETVNGLPDLSGLPGGITTGLGLGGSETGTATTPKPPKTAGDLLGLLLGGVLG